MVSRAALHSHSRGQGKLHGSSCCQSLSCNRPLAGGGARRAEQAWALCVHEHASIQACQQLSHALRVTGFHLSVPPPSKLPSLRYANHSLRQACTTSMQLSCTPKRVLLLHSYTCIAVALTSGLLGGQGAPAPQSPRTQATLPHKRMLKS